MKHLFVTGLFAIMALVASAQTVQDGVKDLYYGRNFEAKAKFDGILAKTPNDPEALYWKGMALLANDQSADAKEHFGKALTASNQAPLVKVGMGHVLLMEEKNAEAKALFDAAISETASKKNKKYGDDLVLKSIGRAHADGSSKIGDPVYGIEKLNQAAELDDKNPEIWLNIGKLNLKRGPEYGGPAKVAFENAIERDPSYARSHYMIGKIFESQKNASQFLDWYNKAIEADKAFAPAYYALYTYYQNKDVNKAGDYLQKYIENAPADKELSYLQADFDFRSGKYAESLAKGKAIEASLNGEPFPKIYKLFALNYSRMGDSVAALQNMEKFMNLSSADRLSNEDYTTLARMALKVPGNTDKAESAALKAVAADTSVAGRAEIMKEMADAYASNSNYGGQYRWLYELNKVKPDNSARTYYFLCDASYKARLFKESCLHATEYIDKFPGELQGYFLNSRAAIAMDPDTSTGSAIPAIDQYNEFLKKDLAKNKNRIINNLGYKIYFYLAKSRQYDLALQAANDILAIDPENAYAKGAKTEAERLIKATGGKAKPNPSPTP